MKDELNELILSIPSDGPNHFFRLFKVSENQYGATYTDSHISHMGRTPLEAVQRFVKEELSS